MLYDDNYQLEGVRLNKEEFTKRDKAISTSKKYIYLLVSSGLFSIHIGGILSNPYYRNCVLLFGVSQLLIVLVIHLRIKDSILVFNEINNEVDSKKLPWKDGFYQHVDRYPIRPIAISWKHSLHIIKLKVNYSLQFLKFIAYRVLHIFFAKSPSENELVAYMLNSTILTLLDVEDRGDKLEVILRIEDLSSPFFQDGKKVNIFVLFEIEEGDYSLERTKIIEFKFDGLDIVKRSEQLLVLSTVTSFYIHPLLHSFSNNVYADYLTLSEQDKEKWDDIFIYGQYLNSVAHTYPADHVGIKRHIASKIYLNNVSKDLKNHGATVSILKDYSRFSNFLIETRKAVYYLATKHELPVNPEAFFLTSIMHSMDHLTTGSALLFRDLSTDKLPEQAYPHLINFMWYLPSENVFTNLLKHKKRKNEFYSELYDAAVKVDKEYADHIALSISY
ncbi:hypothetical protein MY04_05935 (plasmid) [Flammeovirga sp. MY04]|uniref:hypothetical protein n=1 Tax=Flammeovirga sp. MY04 TaxID=1191459 RepID=UPI0008061916|nr:hypothetical protein [Flammeovirga sp. MY04]ANQ52920.1 hypothetical protein MY04_05935 [Flammeovirga sp. MY04]